MFRRVKCSFHRNSFNIVFVFRLSVSISIFSLDFIETVLISGFRVPCNKFVTIDKLIEMRLTTMADAFRNQLDDQKFKKVSFEDRFGMLVDIEYGNRKNNRQKRLIHNTGFDQPEASIMEINYTSGR